jgi:hypothetical protein
MPITHMRAAPPWFRRSNRRSYAEAAVKGNLHRWLKGHDQQEFKAERSGKAHQRGWLPQRLNYLMTRQGVT